MCREASYRARARSGVRGRVLQDERRSRAQGLVHPLEEPRSRDRIPGPQRLAAARTDAGPARLRGAALRQARRGSGAEGVPNVFGWKGERDVRAAVEFLRNRPDVDPERIGGIGLSVGGEMMIEAAAESDGLAAVVSDGAGIRSIRESLAIRRDFFFLGRQYNFPVALEGALKLKEISYIHAEGYPAAEMKHGPIAMIDEKTPTVFIIPSDSLYEKTFSNLEEIKARKGPVIALATEGNERIAKKVNDVICLPATLEPLFPLLSVVALQLLAYHIAVARGCDVDKPRNLAKSVTVE